MLRWCPLWTKVPRQNIQRPRRTISRLTSTKPSSKTSSSPLLRSLRNPKGDASSGYRPWVHYYDTAVRTCMLGLAVLLGTHTFLQYFYSFSDAYGISMLPSFNSFGDWVVVSKKYRRGREMNVGDVVSFKHPIRDSEYAIKRVVGLEGDFVLQYTPGNSDMMIQVPQGHCWVVGDNMKWSRDSRMFGPLPMALIVGKVVGRYEWTGWIPSKAPLEHGLQPLGEDEPDQDTDE